MPLIKIILSKEVLLFKKVISFLLIKENNFEIIFEDSIGNEIISFLNQIKSIVDIILIYLEMQLLNGIEATKIIHKVSQTQR